MNYINPEQNNYYNHPAFQNQQGLPPWYRRTWGIILLVIVFFGVIAGGAYAYLRTKSSVVISPESLGTTASDEVAQLTATIGQYFVLPNETPTLATVTDPEKLKSQPFFAKAKTGDKVLIYTKAQKAILYDPIQKKVIEVAPLAITATATPRP